MATSDVHPDTGEENGNPWTPLKDLAAVVDAAVLRHQPGLQVRMSLTLNLLKFWSSPSTFYII